MVDYNNIKCFIFCLFDIGHVKILMFFNPFNSIRHNVLYISFQQALTTELIFFCIPFLLYQFRIVKMNVRCSFTED
jgi:hypothetical protein